jgi:polyisoprenoid-binding protein YceI
MLTIAADKLSALPMKHLLLALCLPMTLAQAAPVTYQIDPAHTFPSFEADHMGISVWRGKLNRSSGSVVYDKAAGTGTVEVSMDLASIDFGLSALNDWARGQALFNLTSKPATAVYKGRLATPVNGVPSKVEGELSLNGVTRPVTLSISALKCVPHPLSKRDLCGADAYGSFQRDDFGLTAGKDYGFKMDVQLRIQIEAVATE